MIFIKRLTILFLFSALGACAIQQKDLKPVDLNSIKICSGYGCRHVDKISLSDEQWLVIGGYFSPTATSAKQERDQIARAIGQIERYVGPMTKTDFDLPGTFEAPLFDSRRQMDCVDEAQNTTLYLRILREKGWIKYHREGFRVNRGFFFNGWPHTAARVTTLKDKKDFVIDSWFHKNGEAAEVVPLKLWHSGWWPEVIKR